MKKITILVAALAMVSAAGARNLVVNGNFEDPAGTGWTQWWGGNSNRYVTDDVEGDHCAGVWWHDDSIAQTVDIGPGLYELGGKLMTTEGMVDRNGVIRAAIENEAGTIMEVDLAIVPGDATRTWFSKSTTIDNSIMGATQITISLMMANTGAAPAGIVFYDDIYLGSLGISKKAKFPIPADGASVPPITDVLSWQNPDPNNPADAITCTVYLEPDDGNPEFQTDPIATGLAAESVTVVLDPSTTYNWRVDCTDPNTGGNPETTRGDLWTFTTTNDNPPVVEAGPNRYLWLDMADGDGDPTQVTFALAGQLTDDGVSPVTTQWSMIYSEQDPLTDIIITDSAALVTTVTINGTGFYRFQLDASDAFNTAVPDTLEVIVYGNACEAAKGDPDDIPATYPNGIGDVNNDCRVDLEDLAIMAATWLDCLSDKLDCM